MEERVPHLSVCNFFDVSVSLIVLPQMHILNMNQTVSQSFSLEHCFEKKCMMFRFFSIFLDRILLYILYVCNTLILLQIKPVIF